MDPVLEWVWVLWAVKAVVVVERPVVGRSSRGLRAPSRDQGLHAALTQWDSSLALWRVLIKVTSSEEWREAEVARRGRFERRRASRKLCR